MKTLVVTYVALGGRYTMKTAGIVTVLVTGLLLAGCASHRTKIPNMRMDGPIGPIQRLFEAEHGIQLKDEEPAACHQPTPSGVTEIAIERTSCYGYCPMYTLVLRADGTAEWNGYGNVKRIGRRVGTITAAVFESLARMAVEGELLRLKDSYFCAVTDVAAVFVSIVKDGNRKTIFHYAPNINPAGQLYVFEEIVDAVGEHLVRWK